MTCYNCKANFLSAPTITQGEYHIFKNCHCSYCNHSITLEYNSNNNLVCNYIYDSNKKLIKKNKK